MVSTTCSEARIHGNGWQPAQISTLMEAIDDGDIQVTNTTPSAGGSDAEGDEHLRSRIRRLLQYPPVHVKRTVFMP